MPQTAQQFFQTLCNCFKNNQMALISHAFACPAAVYLGDDILVVDTQERVQTVLRSKRQALESFDYATTECSIVAQSICVADHLSIWVEITHLDTQGRTISASTARYFCKRAGEHELRIQLIEYLDLPNPRIFENTAALEMAL